jgi:hypothetical protein
MGSLVMGHRVSLSFPFAFAPNEAEKLTGRRGLVKRSDRASGEAWLPREVGAIVPGGNGSRVVDLVVSEHTQRTG